METVYLVVTSHLQKNKEMEVNCDETAQRKILMRLLIKHVASICLTLGWRIDGKEVQSYVMNLAKQIEKELKRTYYDTKNTHQQLDIWDQLKNGDINRLISAFRKFGWIDIRGTNSFGVIPSSVNLHDFEKQLYTLENNPISLIHSFTVDTGSFISSSLWISSLI